MNNSLPNPESTSTPPATTFNRRGFLRRATIAGATAAIAPAAASLLLNPSSASAAEVSELDVAVLNFALNLEYLEAEFYTLAVYGKNIEDQFGISTTSGDGNTAAGELIVKPNFAKVTFTDPVVAAYATEIADDEAAHVMFLRAALGTNAVARPSIDLYNSFNTAAQAAGIGSAFDPFAGDVDFLVGGYIFEDVGVTAYHGAAGKLSSVYLGPAAGILAVEAYHAGLIRTTLYAKSQALSDPKEITSLCAKISELRDTLDGTSADKDQGIIDPDTGAANIVPTDGHALAFARSAKKVLHIVYGAIGTSGGLFFPNGMNGTITQG